MSFTRVLNGVLCLRVDDMLGTGDHTIVGKMITYLPCLVSLDRCIVWFHCLRLSHIQSGRLPTSLLVFLSLFELSVE